MLERFSEDTYNDAYESTIGVDFRIKTLSILDQTVKVQAWDLAGNVRFRTITQSYYRGGHAILLCFDITNHASFQDINGLHADCCRLC
eukprot:CAMPEP_0202719528 /NCGR_PEP_ID=MMETSP1385-20130828/131902_1 /ASSEMBLY_ACC=CAM_ASM_000861 /TAXON_ID=933848 /ORGANISM="Elphidium margaritaceum" /LENGTH=87 /DNA_ID=CAMNT_0049382769 /DNA_START=1 /DNA_END=261 /DNA_ORIENTATION=+